MFFICKDKNMHVHLCMCKGFYNLFINQLKKNWLFDKLEVTRYVQSYKVVLARSKSLYWKKSGLL